MFERIQFANRGVERPFLGEGAEMEFIDDLSRHVDTGPIMISPAVGGIHDLGRAMRSFRLETRTRIREILAPV